MGHPMLPTKYYPDFSWLPWQRNLRQSGLYLGLCQRYLHDFALCDVIMTSDFIYISVSFLNKRTGG